MSKHAELQALKQEIMSSLHVAMPGEVISYNSEDQTADIQPMIKTRSGKALPLLMGVPVYMPISFDVSEGDVALVVFADMDIDGWIAAGEATEAASDRKHSLSDGFAFVGFMNDGGQRNDLVIIQEVNVVFDSNGVGTFALPTGYVPISVYFDRNWCCFIHRELNNYYVSAHYKDTWSQKITSTTSPLTFVFKKVL